MSDRDPITTNVQARLDANDERAIRAHVEALNRAVRAAQSHGLHVNLGLRCFDGDPQHTEVTVTAIERPAKEVWG